jgi:putative FmdB family regulatory protein
MPVYEYECAECKTKETFVRSVLDKDPGYECQTCNLPLSRVYYPVGVTFNGGGFYSTDNKGK